MNGANTWVYTHAASAWTRSTPSGGMPSNTKMQPGQKGVISTSHQSGDIPEKSCHVKILGPICEFERSKPRQKTNIVGLALCNRDASDTLQYCLKKRHHLHQGTFFTKFSQPQKNWHLVASSVDGIIWSHIIPLWCLVPWL